MANHSPVLIRALQRAAKLRATALGGSATVQSVLEALLTTQFTLSILNGRTVISTSEAGGGTTFTLPDGLTPPEFLELVELAIEDLATHEDPTNPDLAPRRVKRWRVSFAKASL